MSSILTKRCYKCNGICRKGVVCCYCTEGRSRARIEKMVSKKRELFKERTKIILSMPVEDVLTLVGWRSR